MNFDFQTALQTLTWEEGACKVLVNGSYRHRIVITCSPRGRQTAQFANGPFPYFAFLELLNKGQWIPQGTNMAPVLPDGRLVMVVEQRPAQFAWGDVPGILELTTGPCRLDQFGPHSSIEFPGGAVDPGDNSLKAGFLRELKEESAVPDQTALLYRTGHGCHVFGSDIALQHYRGVVFLSDFQYEPHVATDGGLNVMALTPAEVEDNICRGVINNGPAAMFVWDFYKQVMRAREDAAYHRRLIETGYLIMEEVQIKK